MFLEFMVLKFIKKEVLNMNKKMKNHYILLIMERNLLGKKINFNKKIMK